MKRAYIALGIAAFLLCSVLFLPARLFAMVLDDYGVFLLEPEGTVWSGRGLGVVKGKSWGEVDWALAPSQLLVGHVTYEFRIQGELLKLNGVITRDFSTNSLQGNGTVEPRAINQVLTKYGMEMTGRIFIDSLNVKIDDDGVLEQLDGELHWEGGKASYELGILSMSVDLPPVSGALSAEGADAIFLARETSTKLALFKLVLELKTGWLHASATKRLLNLVLYPWYSRASDDTALFEVSHQLYGVTE